MIPRDVLAFLEHLRQRRFDVGPADHLAVGAALRALAASGEDVEGPAAAKWIRPLVCRSQAQLAAFDDEFLDWCRGDAKATADAATPRPAPAPRPTRRGRWWIAASVGAVAVMAAVVFSVSWTRPATAPLKPPTPLTPDPDRGPSTTPPPAPPRTPERIVEFTGEIENPVVATAHQVTTASGPLVLTVGGEGAIQHVAFSPDGTQVATVSAVGVTRLWDAADGRLLKTVRGTAGPVWGTMWTLTDTAKNARPRIDAPTGAFRGRLFITADWPEHVRADGELDGVMLWDDPAHPVEFESFTRVAFSANGSWFAASRSAENGLRVWSTAGSLQKDSAAAGGAARPVLAFALGRSGERFTAYADNTVWRDESRIAQLLAPAERLILSPDEGRIAIVQRGGSTVILDLGGANAATHFVVPAEASASCFSPDGTKFLQAAGTGGVYVADAVTGAQLSVLEGNGATVRTLTVSVDGRSVVAATDDGTAKVWDLDSVVPRTRLVGHEGPVLCAEFDRAAHRVVTGGEDGTARIWTVGADTKPGWSASFPARAAKVDALFSADGSLLLDVRRNGLVWWAFPDWDADAGVGRDEEAEVVACAMSPDATKAAFGTADGHVWLLDRVASESEPGSGPTPPPDGFVGNHTGAVTALAFSSDGARLLSASEDGTAVLSETKTGRAVRRYRTVGGRVTAAALNASGDRVALCTGNNAVWVKDTKPADGETDIEEPVAEVAAHEGRVRHVEFSPTESRVLTCSDDGTAFLTPFADDAGANAFGTLAGHGAAVPYGTFSPDGTRVVTASHDRTARIWDAATGQTLHVLRGHDGPVVFASFSPDGVRVATASDDGTARVWDAATGEEVGVLAAHTGPVRTVRWSPDGRVLATASADGTTKIWDVYRPRSAALRLLAAAAAAALVLWAVRYWLARAYLRRVRAGADDISKTLHAPRSLRSDLVPPGIARDVSRLRRPVATASRVLDVRRTIARTIARGGAPDLAWRTRSRMPEYLALRDRRCADDALWRLHDALVQRLVADGTPIRSFDFARDPRVVRPRDAGAAAVPLDELFARYPADGIVVFGAPETALGPHGAPGSVTQRLLERERHTVVVPVTRDEWSTGAAALTDAGVNVAAVTDPVRRYDGRPQRRPDGVPRPPLPRDLVRDPDAWVSDTPLPDERVRPALDQLCAHLGKDVYAWLCACAVYPEVRWELTIVLGELVRDALALPGRWTFEDLVRLCRLPWMREARMPDWLRTRLLRDLPDAVDRRVRRSFETFLTEEPSELAFRLEVAPGDRGPRRDAANRRIRTAEEGAAGRMGRDAVTLSYMKDPLAVSIGRRLGRALRGPSRTETERPPRALGGALASALVVGTVLGALTPVPTTSAWILVAMTLHLALTGCSRTPTLGGGRGGAWALEALCVVGSWTAIRVARSEDPSWLFAGEILFRLLYYVAAASLAASFVALRRQDLGRAPLPERVADLVLPDRIVAWLAAAPPGDREVTRAPRARYDGWAGAAATWLPVAWFAGVLWWLTKQAEAGAELSDIARAVVGSAPALLVVLVVALLLVRTRRLYSPEKPIFAFVHLAGLLLYLAGAVLLPWTWLRVVCGVILAFGLFTPLHTLLARIRDADPAREKERKP